jgi:hypothetical protein
MNTKNFQVEYKYTLEVVFYQCLKADKNKDDYVKPDDNLLQLLYVFDDQELQNYMCDFETLVNQNVPLQRISLDIANPNENECRRITE